MGDFGSLYARVRAEEKFVEAFRRQLQYDLVYVVSGNMWPDLVDEADWYFNTDQPYHQKRSAALVQCKGSMRKLYVR